MLAKKFRIWPLPLVPLCAGDGESTGRGAVRASGSPPPDLNRTRRDLARVINEAADPLLVKQEILDEQARAEPMVYDNDENFLEFIGPDQDEANHSMEEDEALLDEGTSYLDEFLQLLSNFCWSIWGAPPPPPP
jgi:hypothetical protein